MRLYILLMMGLLSKGVSVFYYSTGNRQFEILIWELTVTSEPRPSDTVSGTKIDIPSAKITRKKAHNEKAYLYSDTVLSSV